MDKKKLTPQELYELAKEKYFKVYDFDSHTKAADKEWIRVGLIPDPNQEIQWNFFNGERLLTEEPFDKAEDFENGVSVVIRGHKYNVLKMDGTLLFPEWYDYVCRTGPNTGYIVERKLDEYGLNRESAFADNSGTLLSEFFSNILPMLHNELYCVQKKTGKGVLERICAVYDFATRQLISEWYDDVSLYMGKVKWARVKQNGKYNLLGADGKPIFGLWSSKPITVDEKGKCQLFDSAGGGYNGDISTGQVTEIH